MAEASLRVEPEGQAVDPGHPALFTVHVVHQSDVVDRVAFDILGSAGAWSQIEPPTVALFPGADARATVVVTPPSGTPLGPVPLEFRAVAETSGFVEVAEATLHVGSTRVVEAELRPRTANGSGGRRAWCCCATWQRATVSVAATDPDDAIVFDAPSGVQVAPGIETELPLRMRLPVRRKQGALARPRQRRGPAPAETGGRGPAPPTTSGAPTPTVGRGGGVPTPTTQRVPTTACTAPAPSGASVAGQRTVARNQATWW